VKLEVKDIRKRKSTGPRLTMLTAYDAGTAAFLEQEGIDLILVGDTLGMVVQGYDTTRVVTLDHICYHVSIVAHGAPHTFVVGDLPFGTYDTPAAAVASSRRVIDAGASAVKLEGNPPGVVSALAESGIPVMGHLGLLPQTAESFRVRGKEQAEAERILADARDVERAGAFSLVLESVPEGLARTISHALTIPTIGIGAGRECDGQVLVIHDLLGLTTNMKPKFVKRFANLAPLVRAAVRTYIDEVQSGTFPDAEHTYH
jgi:3-methyl-2-oxobutanoate hydroxymethyltransferase